MKKVMWWMIKIHTVTDVIVYLFMWPINFLFREFLLPEIKLMLWPVFNPNKNLKLLYPNWRKTVSPSHVTKNWNYRNTRYMLRFLEKGDKWREYAVARTPYHVVDPSPWPVLMGICLWSVAVTFISWVYYIPMEKPHVFLGMLVLTSFGWIRDIILESTFQGFHTEKVQSGLTLGFILFLVSELMLFFSFFWAFFHMALSPSIEIGGCWPPIGVHCLDWSGTPLHNTALLVMSSGSISSAHHFFMDGEWDIGLSVSYGVTLYLSYLFIKNQYMEYMWLPFTIADGVYGSCFFMLTGLHGLHVIAGTCGLVFCGLRILFIQFSDSHHVALTLAIWYWHFVDVVWLALFFIIYIWGS